MEERLPVTLEENAEEPKKPTKLGFFKKHKNKIIAGACAAGGALLTFLILGFLGEKETGEDDLEARKAFESSVDGSFDGSGLS